MQSGTNLAVPVRPDQGGGGEVPQRAARVEPGGAQEPGLVELHRAQVPHPAAEPETNQVSFIPHRYLPWNWRIASIVKTQIQCDCVMLKCHRH